MKRPLITTAILCALMAAVALRIAIAQRRETVLLRGRIEQAEAELIATPAAAAHTNGATVSGPSLELLRLRGQVAALRRELRGTNAPILRPPDRATAKSDWDYVHALSRRPSESPDFRPADEVRFAGFKTPETTVESFFFRMEDQKKNPLDPEELWDVPKEFGRGWGLNLGSIPNLNAGYRIAEQRWASPEEVTLMIQTQRRDGTPTDDQITLVWREDRWRIRPQSVTPPAENAP